MKPLIDNFTFCPQCKGPLNKIGDGLINCPSCGFHFYLKPSLTTALILENSKGKIFLTKRKFPPKKNYWDVPGGFINLKETAEECLRREIKEELGIKLSKINYFGSYWSYYPYKNIDYQTLCLVYTAKYEKQKITLNDDVKGGQFIPKKNIRLNELSFDDIRNALRDYLRLGE